MSEEVLKFMQRRWDNIKAIQEKRMNIFLDPFFRKAPAMFALKDIAEPKPEHVRACLMEIARHLLSFGGEVPKATELQQYVVVVTVNDEPPKPPVITGVFGPFSEKQADEWAKIHAAVYKTASLCITPLDKDKE